MDELRRIGRALALLALGIGAGAALVGALARG